MTKLYLDSIKDMYRSGGKERGVQLKDGGRAPLYKGCGFVLGKKMIVFVMVLMLLCYKRKTLVNQLPPEVMKSWFCFRSC